MTRDTGTRGGRVTVEVTAADIARAHVADSYRCVVAQAIARTLPGATRIEVDIQTIRFTLNGERLIYLTPYTAAGYVVAFDAGDKIHPFRFQLRDPIKGRRRVRTAAGVDVGRKENQVRAERNRAARAEAVLAGAAVATSKREVATAKEIVEAAPEKIAAAEKELADARAAYREAGVTLASQVGRRNPPKVSKTKKRNYGHRLLRVNQAEGRQHFA